MIFKLAPKNTVSRIILFALMALSITMIYSPAIWAATRITVKLEDLETGKAVDATRVSLETSEESIELTRKGAGMYEYKGSIEDVALEACNFKVETKDSYSSRTIIIKGVEFKKAGKTFTFSLAKDKGIKFTYDYLSKGQKYFSMNKFDGALAYYEVAYLSGGENLVPENQHISEFDVLLANYYATALRNTCVKLSYDTCDLSASLFQQLLTLSDSGKHTKLLKKISRNNVIAALNDLALVAPTKKYSKISKLYGQGKFAASASLAAEALDEQQADPQTFSKIGLTKDRLLTDAGVSFLKAADKAQKESAPTEEVQNSLVSAGEFLKQVKKPDSATTKNLTIINEKLSILNNPL